jgi:hypothetical protein
MEPLGGSFTILTKDAEQGSFDIAADFEEFEKFGVGLDLPIGAIKSFEMIAPGGLSDSGTSAGGRIGPAYVDNFRPHIEVLEVVDSNDVVVASLRVHMETLTRGSAGLEVRGHDDGECHQVTIRIWSLNDDLPKVSFGITTIVSARQRVADLVAGVRFIRALAEHGKFVWRPEFGPNEFGRGTAEIEDVDAIEATADLVEDLFVIQQATMLPIYLPDEITQEEAFAISRVAGLLSGQEEKGRWTGAKLEIEPGEVPEAFKASLDQDVPGVVEEPLTLTLDGTEYKLGKCHLLLASIRLVDSAEDGAVRVKPGKDDTWVRRVGPKPG